MTSQSELPEASSSSMQQIPIEATEIDYQKNPWMSLEIPGGTYDEFELDDMENGNQYMQLHRIYMIERAKHMVPLILKHCSNSPMQPKDLLRQICLCSAYHVHQMFESLVNKNWSNLISLVNNYCKTKLVLAESEKTTAVPISEALLETAFRSDFSDNVGYRDYILSLLNKYASRWDPHFYYFPGVAVIQSSGSGKSRTLTSLTEKGVYVIYCSFQPGLTGFPLRSHIADQLSTSLSDATHAEYYYLSFFLACRDRVNEAIKNGISPQELLDRHLPVYPGKDRAFWTEVEEKIGQILPRLTVTMNGSVRPILPEAMNAVIKEYFGQEEGSLKMLVVFDEVNALLPREQPSASHGRVQRSSKKSSKLQQATSKIDIFVGMRRGARWIPCKCGFLVAMLDTTVRVSNSALPKALEPSERVVGDGVKLFDPIYYFASFDFAAPDIRNMSMEEAFKPSVLYSYGRPLWPSLLSSQQTIDNVKLLAASKLLGGAHHFGNIRSSDQEYQYTQEQCLSVLRSRFPFVVSRSDLASELVASYMWFCTFISKDQSSLMSTMPSEPILAEAGCLWMSQRNFRKQAFKTLSKAVSMGTVESGAGGEFTAQALFILARDKVAYAINGDNKIGVKSELSKPLSLKRMLFALLHAGYVRELCLRSADLAHNTGLADPIEKGMVAFTHFVHVHSFPTVSQMMHLFARGAAVTCSVGQKGVDLLLIVLMPNSEGRYILSEENITFVLVQVKSHSDRGKDKHYPSTATQKNSPFFVGMQSLPPRHLYLSMYMGFGDKTSWPEFPDSPIPDETTIPDDLQRFLIKTGSDEEYESEWKKVANRIDSMSDGDKELIRRYRQVTFAILGFDHRIYPCIMDDSFQDSIMDCTGLSDPAQRQRGDQEDIDTKSVSTKLVRWDNPHSLKLVQDTSFTKTEAAVIKCFQVLLRTGKDPASLHHSHQRRQKMVKIMCTPSYLDTTTQSLRFIGDTERHEEEVAETESETSSSEETETWKHRVVTFVQETAFVIETSPFQEPQQPGSPSQPQQRRPSRKAEKKQFSASQ